jgi:hypothetical protein
MENKETTQDYSKWNLFKKMLHIENEIQTVKKELTVKLPNGTYKAVGEIDVLNAVKPIEFKYGVKSLPISREVVELKETETKSGTVNQFIRVKATYRFINVDNPSETLDIESLGDGVDSGDKSSGKAQTYADKYALLKAYKIATGDDPDQDGSEEQKTIKNGEIKETKEKLLTGEQLVQINTLVTPERLSKLLAYYKVSKLEELTLKQASEAIKTLQKK